MLIFRILNQNGEEQVISNLIDNYEHLNPKSEWGRAEEAREERIRTCEAEAVAGAPVRRSRGGGRRCRRCGGGGRRCPALLPSAQPPIA